MEKIKEEKINRKEITEKNYQKFLEKIVYLAFFEAKGIKKDCISPECLILALYHVNDSKIADVFNFYRVEKNDLAIAFVLNYLSRNKS